MDDSEKFAFTSTDNPVPKCSITFGFGNEVPLSSRMCCSLPRSLGTRFYSGQDAYALDRP